MDDKLIIELYEKRDETAIEGTKDKYGKYMNTIAYNVLRSLEDSEECVSDSYLKTWNAIPPAKPDNLKAFVGRITRNTALDYLERMSAQKRGGGEAGIVLDEMAECICRGASDSGDPSAAVEAKELACLINDMLGNLSQDARRIFVLRYYYMYSVGEIAEKLDVKVGKVSTSLSRSRSVLSALLKREGYHL